MKHVMPAKLLMMTFLVFLASAACGTTSYKMTVLGTLPGGGNSVAYGINTYGEVVGSSGTGTGHSHAFIWDATSGMRDLGTLSDGTWSVATSINDTRQVVGRGDGAGVDGYTFALLWDAMGRVRYLPWIGASAWDINNAGQTVGEYRSSPSTTGVFVWDGGPYFLTPPAPAGGTSSSASGINGQGRVVGTYYTSASSLHSFTWDLVSGMQDVGTFSASAINDLNQVAGDYYVGSRTYHAMVWDQVNGIRDIGTLPGDDNSYALSINNAGQVVGWSSSNAGYRAFLWSLDTGMIDFGVGQAFGINNAGQIVGQSGNYAVVWEPVPEPSSLLALAGGLAGVGVMRRRKLLR